MKPYKNKAEKDYSKENPECLGGFGEKCNRDTQYHLQNRIYSSRFVSIAVTTAFQPWYLIRYEDCNKHSN